MNKLFIYIFIFTCLLAFSVVSEAGNIRSMSKARRASTIEKSRYEAGRLSRYKRHLHQDWNRQKNQPEWVIRNGWRTYDIQRSAHESFKRHNKVYD